MSRSLHTDPYEVRAARRVIAPFRPRRFEPRGVRQSAVDGASGRALTGGPPARVEVRATPARRGFVHPAGVGDVARVLDFFGPPAVYGLRRVELRQRAGGDRAGLLVAGLRPPGVVVLVEQPRPPWLIPGRLAAGSLRRLHRAGALVQVGATHTRVDWPGEHLRDFVLFDGLMHELGHHALQHEARAMRTADHERRADAFAAACRAAWTTGGAAAW